MSLAAYALDSGDEAAAADVERALARDPAALDALIAARKLGETVPPAPLSLIRWARDGATPWRPVVAPRATRRHLWTSVAVAASLVLICVSGFHAGARSASSGRARAADTTLARALGPTFDILDVDNGQLE